MPTPTLMGSSRCRKDPFTHGAHFQKNRDRSKSKQRENTRAHVLKCTELPRDMTRARRGWRRGGGGAQLLGLGLALEAKVCAGPGGGARWHLPPDAQAWFWKLLCTHTHPSLCGPAGGGVRLPHCAGPRSPWTLLSWARIPAGHSRSNGQWEGRAFTASLEAPGLSGSISRRPLWGPSRWADASMQRRL